MNITVFEEKHELVFLDIFFRDAFKILINITCNDYVNYT